MLHSLWFAKIHLLNVSDLGVTADVCSPNGLICPEAGSCPLIDAGAACGPNGKPANPANKQNLLNNDVYDVLWGNVVLSKRCTVTGQM